MVDKTTSQSMTTYKIIHVVCLCFYIENAIRIDIPKMHSALTALDIVKEKIYQIKKERKS